jgi:D-xylulose reductase
MQALVLESVRTVRLREIELPREVGPHDVRIAIKAVGICGSDVHYYTHGAIGPFVVREPMVLGHEAAGQVLAVGEAVRDLAPGDRVCMEPGIPDWTSRASRLGHYNLDPSVRFWATPPIHGCLTPEVVHPANLTYKLPAGVSFQEGAFVEPLAIGMQAATKARIELGQVAVVVGAGTIGLMTALAALAGGCAEVFVIDVVAEKLAIAGQYSGLRPLDARRQDAVAVVREATGGWGADVVFEESGSPKAYENLFDFACPGGCAVLIGLPTERVAFDVVGASVKELRLENVFRYANVYPRAIALLGSGKIDVKPLISRTFPFTDAVAAIAFAAEGHPDVVKTQILFP